MPFKLIKRGVGGLGLCVREVLIVLLYINLRTDTHTHMQIHTPLKVYNCPTAIGSREAKQHARQSCWLFHPDGDDDDDNDNDGDDDDDDDDKWSEISQFIKTNCVDADDAVTCSLDL